MKERLEAFFIHIAHGDAGHRLWLHKEFHRFWGVEMDSPAVMAALVPPSIGGVVPVNQFDEKIWRTGCDYQAEGFCIKCGRNHDQTYKEAHGTTFIGV